MTMKDILKNTRDGNKVTKAWGKWHMGVEFLWKKRCIFSGYHHGHDTNSDTKEHKTFQSLIYTGHFRDPI